MSDILMPNPLAPFAIDQLAALGTLHRLWEAPDREAMLAQWPAGGEAVSLQRPAAQAA